MCMRLSALLVVLLGFSFAVVLLPIAKAPASSPSPSLAIETPESSTLQSPPYYETPESSTSSTADTLSAEKDSLSHPTFLSRTFLASFLKHVRVVVRVLSLFGLFLIVELGGKLITPSHPLNKTPSRT